MRAYLLGQLPDGEAAALEEKYFVNRSFFLKLQSAEAALIDDYLANNLPAAERESFESRYLEIPDLRRKVDEARRERAALARNVRPSVWAGWRLAFAAGLVLALGLGTWLYYAAHSERSGLAARIQPPAKSSVSVASIYLSPGLTKGAGSLQVEFQQPAPDSTLSLILELPGQTSPVERTVEISMVQPDENLRVVWSSPQPVLSSFNQARATQALVLSLPGSLFQPGDYVIKASANKGEVHETYSCHVAAARQ
jgi:hypothetical protein